MRRVGTVLAALIVFLGGVVYANAQSETFTGCLTPGGQLTKVALGAAPARECAAGSTEVSWSVEGPAGPQGPTGPQGPQGSDGGLSCDDELRINAAVPAFAVRDECGLIVVATGLTEDGSPNFTSSNFVESFPFGNPPGDHDVAHRFEVVSETNVEVEYIDIAVRAWTNTGPLDVYLVSEREAPTNPNLTSEPDMSAVLEQWQLTPQDLLITGGRLLSSNGPELETGHRYWLVLSVTEPSTRYQWFTGALPEMAGSAKAERYDFAIGEQPAGTWIGSDQSNGSAGLRVVGLPLES